jgi:alkylation response protein AidB-like acyl-CoA dehydrogenase
VHVLLNEEEEPLAETVFQQAVELGPGSVESRPSYDDEKLWHALGASEVLGLGLPESVGGYGTVFDAALVTMALGRALAQVPYLGAAILPSHLLTMAGARAELVQEVVQGSRRIGVGIDPTTQRLATERSAAAFAWDAAGADVALVLAGDGSGRLVAVALDDDTTGLDVTRRVRPCVLGDRRSLGLEDTSAVLTDGALARWETLALSLISADMVGVMEGALALGVEHVTTRQQFGVAIGTFQALQHLLAEQHVSVEGARATTFYAAWAFDGRPAESVSAAHTAKAYASEHGKRLCEAVLQVHGGMGMTWECQAHVFLKRMLVDRALLGDERHHLRAIAAAERSAREGM